MYSTQLSHGLDQLGDHYDPIIIIGGPWGSQPRLGRDVTSFDNSTWEMMHGLLDTVQAIHYPSQIVSAHKEPDDKAQILHRYISVGNILITDDER
jgi:hypothetical protein